VSALTVPLFFLTFPLSLPILRQLVHRDPLDCNNGAGIIIILVESASGEDDNTRTQDSNGDKKRARDTRVES